MFIKLSPYLVYLVILISFTSCKDKNVDPLAVEPYKSDILKLILSADKTSGIAPLTIIFTGVFQGNTDSIRGQVPDYIFYSRTGKTIIPYSIPDTSQNFSPYWRDTVTYHNTGVYKVVLVYQGLKNHKDIDILSDTLLIKVN
jgi:hypothetical protein